MELWYVNFRPPIAKRERKQRCWRYVVMATTAKEAVELAQKENPLGLRSFSLAR